MARQKELFLQFYGPIDTQKYREFRVRKHNLEVNPISECRTTDLSEGVKHIVDKHNQKIADLKKQIREYEKINSNWNLLKKISNADVKELLRRVLNADENTIKQFEVENFRNDDNWTRPRKAENGAVMKLTLSSFKTIDEEGIEVFEEKKTPSGTHTKEVSEQSELEYSPGSPEPIIHNGKSVGNPIVPIMNEETSECEISNIDHPADANQQKIESSAPAETAERNQNGNGKATSSTLNNQINEDDSDKDLELRKKVPSKSRKKALKENLLKENEKSTKKPFATWEPTEMPSTSENEKTPAELHTEKYVVCTVQQVEDDAEEPLDEEAWFGMKFEKFKNCDKNQKTQIKPTGAQQIAQLTHLLSPERETDEEERQLSSLSYIRNQQIDIKERSVELLGEKKTTSLNATLQIADDESPRETLESDFQQFDDDDENGEEGSEDEEEEEEDEELRSMLSEKSYQTGTTSTTAESDAQIIIEQNPISISTNKKRSSNASKKKRGKKCKKGKKTNKGPKMTPEEIEAIRKKKKLEADKAFAKRENEMKSRLEKVDTSDRHKIFRRLAKTALEMFEKDETLPIEIQQLNEDLEYYVQHSDEVIRMSLRDLYLQTRVVEVSKAYIGSELASKMELLTIFQDHIDRCQRFFQFFMYLNTLDAQSFGYTDFELMSLKFYFKGYEDPALLRSSEEYLRYEIFVKDVVWNVHETEQFTNAIDFVRRRLIYYEEMSQTKELTRLQCIFKEGYMGIGQLLTEYKQLTNATAFLQTYRDNLAYNLMEAWFLESCKPVPYELDL